MDGSAPVISAFDPASEDTFSGSGEVIGLESSPSGLISFNQTIPNGFLQNGANLENKFSSSIDQWNPDPALFPQELPMMVEENNMNWNTWNDMVKDFEPSDGTNGDIHMPNGFGPQGLTIWF